MLNTYISHNGLTGCDGFLVDLVGGVAGGESSGVVAIGVEYKSKTWWQMSTKKILFNFSFYNCSEWFKSRIYYYKCECV